MSIYSDTPKHTTEQLMAVLRDQSAPFDMPTLTSLCMAYGFNGGANCISTGEFLADVARVMYLIDSEYNWDEFSGVHAYDIVPGVADQLQMIEERFDRYEVKDLSPMDWEEIAAMIRRQIEAKFD